jgi:hypothetical protein
LELEVDDNKVLFKEFNQEVRRLLGQEKPQQDIGDKPSPEDWAEFMEFDEDFQEGFSNIVSNIDIKEADEDFTPEVFDDTYLNMELTLPNGDGAEPAFARVTKQLRNANGLPIDTAHDNPILDSRMYEVDYQDGHKAAMAANAIAQNLFAQVDAEGNCHVLFDEIIDHCTNGKELKQQDPFLTTRSGTRQQRETTISWEILVQWKEWKDQSTSWIALKDMKDSFPVQRAEYSVRARISQEPAFAWWVSFVRKKRNRIITKVKSKYWVCTHKFGIRVPKSVAKTKRLHQANSDTLWWDAICKEAKNVRIAFEEFEGDVSAIPPGYQEIRCHMIFDIKMGETFRRKARMVADGHRTETPAALTYSSVVSRDSVLIALTIPALNDLIF